MQAILTKDSALALLVLQPLYVSTTSDRVLWAESLSWVLAFTEPKVLFPTEPLVATLFRQVQLRFALALNHESASQLAESLLNEVSQLNNAKAPELLVAMVAMDVLLATKTAISPKLLLKCWLVIMVGLGTSDLLKNVAKTIEAKRKTRFTLGGETFPELLFGFILHRRGSCDFISQLIQAIDELPEPDRGLVVGTLRGNESGLRRFIDQSWLQESNEQKPDWKKVIGVLRSSWDAGRRWRLVELTALSARGISIIHDEYMKKTEKALDILDQAAKEIGTDATMLRYQRGNVFYRQNRLVEAHDQWVTVKPEMKTDGFDGAADALFAYPKFGEVAGKLEKWGEAIQIFTDGRAVAKSIKEHIHATAFGVDTAHVLWMSGKKAEAISLFAACLKELETNPGNQEPDEFHAVWKISEQIVRWCSINAGAHGTSPVINRIGLCSENKSEERINLVKGTPKAPICQIWIFLAEAEFYAGLGHAVFDKLLVRKDVDYYIGPRAIKASLVLRRAMSARQFSDLPLLVEEIAISATIAKERADKEFFSHGPQPGIPKEINGAIDTFAIDPFCVAIITGVVDGKDWQPNIAAWRDSAKKAVTSYDFKSLFDRIEEVMKLGQDDAGKIYKSSQTRLDRILSSIRLATSFDSSLSACLVGCVSLVTDESFIFGFNNEGIILGQMVRGLWLKRLNFRAEFNLPRFSVPAVEAACNLPFTGLKLAACVLLAAESAVATRVPQNTQAILLKLAAG